MNEHAILMAIVEIPIVSIKRSGYTPQYVSNFRLTQEQGEELRRLKSGLIGVGATVDGGRRVESDASVFQWMLEHVARARVHAEQTKQ